MHMGILQVTSHFLGIFLGIFQLNPAFIEKKCNLDPRNRFLEISFNRLLDPEKIAFLSPNLLISLTFSINYHSRKPKAVKKELEMIVR